MELTNEFRVNVPIARAWTVLTDIERIAPCLPGAQLEEIEGDEFRGNVKIKVGPITAQYKGKATFIERDDVNHRAVLRGEGRDTKGQGNASAMITAQLTSEGDSSTRVRVVTDLTITGRVAQFGRGVLADVSAKLLGQFVQCLEHDVLVQPEETLSGLAAASASAAGAGAAVGTAGSTGAAGTAFPPPPPPPPMVSVEGGATRLADATLVDAPVLSPPESASSPRATEASATEASATEASTTAAATTAAATTATAEPSTGSAAATAVPATDTATTPVAPAAPQVRKIAYQPSQPVDLLDAAGTPVLKRVAPLGAILLILLWFLRRRRG